MGGNIKVRTDAATPTELKLQILCKLSSLRQFQEDPEYVHIKADALLCELLTQLGFSEVVDEYIALPKYYS